jgi:hypothetical protein
MVAGIVQAVDGKFSYVFLFIGVLPRGLEAIIGDVVVQTLALVRNAA